MSGNHATPHHATPEAAAVRLEEAARILGVGTRKVAELKASGALPYCKVGTATLYPVEGLRAYIAAATTPARTGPLAEGGGR